MYADTIDTPLGPVIAVADQEALYSLNFADRHGIVTEPRGKPAPILSIERELHTYFKNGLTQFQTPIHLIGTAFQKKVWLALQQIPGGETRSYAGIAKAIGNPLAVRAVGTANGANPLCIIVPCHRVINTGGGLGGYGGGLERKKWLLSHESISKL
jgi:AraC family transcriptional regulator of adaptative response/methylated-DNA-[protein]-cysteine methyltransferase